MTAEEIDGMSFDRNSGVGEHWIVFLTDESSGAILTVSVDPGIEMRVLPMWKRLHGYWRTLPHLNRFYYPLKVEDTAPSSVAESSKKRKNTVSAANSFCKVH